jgi:AbrB family looped-hinge helix DNA binding protein
MSAVLVSTKGQIVLPAAVRKALGLKPGMRVDIRVEGKGARITPAPVKNTAKLSDIQAILTIEELDNTTISIANSQVIVNR